jgi:hypothetical protein
MPPAAQAAGPQAVMNHRAYRALRILPGIPDEFADEMTAVFAEQHGAPAAPARSPLGDDRRSH